MECYGSSCSRRQRRQRRHIFRNYGKYYRRYLYFFFYPITPDRSNPSSGSTLGQEFFPEIWGPIMESETEFFGPSRFAAVKPKKLVIADDGLAFYTDTDGVLKFKNKNRIVYVDLESFAITGYEATNVSLEDDCTFLGAHGSNFGDTNNAYSGINFYDESDNQYSSTVYGGIPCGDSQ